MEEANLKQEKRRSFHEVSRIDYLKRRIVEQVRTKGEFYRIKTFIDIISNPILESMENLLEQSQCGFLSFHAD